jgi:hypothetical protein
LILASLMKFNSLLEGHTIIHTITSHSNDDTAAL